MKYHFYITFLITTILTVTCIPAFAGQVRVIEFRATSLYGQNYARGFDRGYAAAWNACRTGDELHRWVRDWSNWVITNPAYVRGYQEGVTQAVLDSEYLQKESMQEPK